MKASSSNHGPLRPASRAVRRFVLAYRRMVAGALAALAVVVGISALEPADPATSAVVVAAHDLSSGTDLSDDDLEVRHVPSEAVASNAYTAVDDVAGESLSGPVRRGEAITDMRVIGTDLLAGYPPGSTLATVRIADTHSLWGVEAGTYIDVVGVDVDGDRSGKILADDAQVVAIPESADDSRAGSSGVSVVVCVPEDAAVGLAEAATRMQLGVIVSADAGDSHR
ncbi:MAG TPA: SAF domain-containing protein [Nocardioidaceae bacterium]|nr:SAF domain-containing protein [Nocardioidaceae bacterium]